MTWTYTLNPKEVERDAVRFRLGDTNESDPQLQDEEIAYLLDTYGSVLGASAAGARAIGAMYARKVDKAVGDLKISYSQRAAQYEALASELASSAGLDVPAVGILVGGLSVIQREADDADRDIPVGAGFDIGMDDFEVPVSAPTDEG